jgi:rhamnose utilization protein RhaD (predicted bifunctional aldolase and dehydrogenase)
MDDPRQAVIRFCAEIGNDPLLVQGAGGNVSWKDGDTLWVKASGTWLADAARSDIFVPVDLAHLRGGLANGDFAIQPALAMAHPAKPSIETLLHALMPHRIVVHLHAVDVLAWLVREDCASQLRQRLGDHVRWALVDYFKPGAELAHAVGKALAQCHDAQIIFMKNHGLVIGSDSIAGIRSLLDDVIARLCPAVTVRQPVNTPAPPLAAINGHVPVSDARLHQLACDAALYERLQSDWALYPDHVVFLGATARCYDSPEQLRAAHIGGDTTTPAFVRNRGVYAGAAFGAAGLAQLRCYYDVLARLPDSARLVSLTPEQVQDLLNRSDEKYRMQLTREPASP